MTNQIEVNGEESNHSVNPDHSTESKNMEVHHHPEVERKTFKDYLLEGFMIFIAVTMGFFAETIRENITEHERAKFYAETMLKDLEADTAQLNPYKAYFSYAACNVDTLMQLVAGNDPKNIPSGKLYWYGLWGGAHRYFIPNDATLQQMKSSGSLRYFEKTVGHEVAKYDRFCRMIQTNEEMLKDIYSEVRKSRAQIFDYKYNEIANLITQTNRNHFSQEKIDSFINTNPPLLSYEKTLMNQYVEMVRSRFLHQNVQLADSLLIQASKLIEQLKKQYDLEDVN
jgi:hypothetical protein